MAITDWDEKPQKDYMGCISWSRIMCGAPQAMFGSEIKTSNPIHIRIDAAKIVKHGACDETILPANRPYIDIEMTPVQWAEFLTSGACGEGVPCTVMRIGGKSTSKVEEHSIAEAYDIAVKERFDEFDAGMRRFEKIIETALGEGKALTKTQLKEMLHDMDCFRHNAVANVRYTQTRFKEDMAKVVCKARAEVNAYAERVLVNTGVKCLMNDTTLNLPTEDKSEAV